MAYNAGDVEAKLTLDRTPFSQGLALARKEAEKAEKKEYKLKLGVEDKVSPQLTAIQKKLTAFASKKYETTVGVNFGKSNGDITAFTKRLQNLGQRKVRPEIAVSTGKSVEEIEKVKAAFVGLKNTELKIKADTTQAYKSLYKLNASLDRLVRDRTIKIHIKPPSTTPLNKSIAQFTKPVKIDADIGPIISKMRMVAAALDAMGKHTVKVKIDAQANVAGARTDLMSLWLLADQLNRKKININVDARGIPKTVTQLKTVEAAHRGAGSGANYHMQRLVLLAGVISGLIGPALGTLAALLLTVPTALFIFGAGIGAVMLGMDGLKKAAGVLTPAIDKMKASLSKTIEDGMTPIFRQWLGIFPMLTEQLNGTARALIGWAQAFTNVAASAQGMNTIKSILQGVNSFIVSLNPSVTSMTSAFLTLGLVGAQNLGSLSNALNGFTSGFDAMVQNAAKTGELGQAFQQLGNVVGALLGLLNTLFEVGIKLMVALGPDLTQAISALGEMMKGITPSLIELGKGFLAVVTYVAQFLGWMGQIGVLAPVVGVIVGLTVAIKAYEVAMKLAAVATAIYKGAMVAWQVVTAAATIAQWGLNAALLANPVGIVVAAVLLLIAAIVALGYGIYKLIQNWDSVSAALSKGWQWLVDLFHSLWDPIADWFAGLWDRIKNSVSSAVSAVGQWFSDMGTSITDFADRAGKSIALFFENLPTKIAQWLGYALGSIAKWGMDIGKWLVTEFPRHMENLGKWFQELPGKIGSWLAKTATSFYNSASEWVTNLIAGMRERDRQIRQWFIELPGKIITWLGDTATWLLEKGQQLITGLRDGIVTGWNATIEWFRNLPTNIANFFADAGTWLLEVGGNIIDGLISGLTNAGNAVLAWFGRLADSFILGFKQALGIASPSKVFADIGGFIIQGLMDGMIAIWTALETWIKDSINNFINYFKSNWGALADYWSAQWDNIKNTATTVWNAISSYLTAQINNFRDFFQNVWGAIRDFFSSIWNAIRDAATSIWNAIRAFYDSGFTNFRAFFEAIWTAIRTFFETIWNSIRNTATTIWNAIKAFFDVSLTAYRTMWETIWNAIINFFTTTWNNIRDTATRLWNSIRDFFNNALNNFSTFWSGLWTGIRDNFTRIFEGIVETAKRIWQNVKDVFRGGLNAIVGGINWPIDKINGIFGISIPRVPEVGPFALGGTPADTHSGSGAVHGRGGPTDDRVPALLSPREHVLSAKEVIGLGGHDGVKRLRAQALQKQRGLAMGGSVNVNDFNMPKIANGSYVIDPQIAKYSKHFLNALNAGQPEAFQAAGGKKANPYHKFASGGSVPNFAAGGALQNAINFARGEDNKPYQWGGVGNPSWDCSGFMSGITNVLRGRAPRSRLGTTATMPWGGFRSGLNGAFTIGNTKSRGHMAGTLAGVNVESGGSNGVHYGPPAIGSTNSLFNEKYTLPEVGGVFVDGGAGGGGIDLGALFDTMAGWVKAAAKLAARGILPDNPPWLEPMGLSFIDKGWEGLKSKAVSLMGSIFGGGGSSGAAGSPEVVAAVRGVANNFGWGAGAQWDAIYKLVQKESSWNPNAANPNSSARGLFQKMTSIHGPVEPTPAGQAQWGLNYIRGRYGTPTAAWAFHQRNNHYDNGGFIPKGVSSVINATNNRENAAVFTTDQWQTLSTLTKDEFSSTFSGMRGISPDDLKNIVGNLAATSSPSGPTSVSIAPQLPAGADVHEVIREILFYLRHYQFRRK